MYFEEIGQIFKKKTYSTIEMGSKHDDKYKCSAGFEQKIKTPYQKLSKTWHCQ